MTHVLVIALVAVFLLVNLTIGRTGTISQAEKEGAKRTGRIGLWLVCPPVGLWRSWKHGQRKRDERMADLGLAKDYIQL